MGGLCRQGSVARRVIRAWTGPPFQPSARQDASRVPLPRFRAIRMFSRCRYDSVKQGSHRKKGEPKLPQVRRSGSVFGYRPVFCLRPDLRRNGSARSGIRSETNGALRVRTERGPWPHPLCPLGWSRDLGVHRAPPFTRACPGRIGAGNTDQLRPFLFPQKSLKPIFTTASDTPN